MCEWYISSQVCIVVVLSVCILDEPSVCCVWLHLIEVCCLFVTDGGMCGLYVSLESGVAPNILGVCSLVVLSIGNVVYL